MQLAAIPRTVFQCQMLVDDLGREVMTNPEFGLLSIPDSTLNSSHFVSKMSSGPHIEQDRDAPGGGQELPTYDDLVAQNGPNSRFGRWRGWIEKRAAERYADVSPEERVRRRERGWGNDDEPGAPSETVLDSGISPPRLSGLHIQTRDLPSSTHASPKESPPLPPLPFKSQRLFPSHLKINQFGSRFLPHTTSPIHCLLPLDSGRLLLIGHEEGLSVLDMFPQEWSDRGGILSKGPEEARARLMWHGESVFQMSLLEVEAGPDGMPQGVVLVLVGSDADVHFPKDADTIRSLRMYNLSSLISLARWTISQKDTNPLDLQRPSHWNVQQSPSKRGKVAKNLRALVEATTALSHSQQDPLAPPAEYPPSSSSPSSLAPAGSMRSMRKRSNPGSISSMFSVLSPNRKDSDETSWDIVDDLPLRWGTDFVPLAIAGSRLANVSVLSYALWTDDNRKGKGGQLLAVATKGSIFLYETPKGERAFRYVKEFYTPLQPRSISFFQQILQDTSRESFDMPHTHKRTNSNAAREGSRPLNVSRHGPHLGLFVVFEKKAGWIRITDSAVGEFNLYDDGNTGTQQYVHSQRSGEHLNNGPSILRSRISLEGSRASEWLPIAHSRLPQDNISLPGVEEVYFLTRGRQTHIVPCPLPVNMMPVLPLAIVTWKSLPASVSIRVLYSIVGFRGDGIGELAQPLLQLIAFGEDGVEVQEISISSLGKGKGKAQQIEEPVGVLEDLCGDTGFLCAGGHWEQSHHPYYRNLQRSSSMLSTTTTSTESFSSMGTDAIVEKLTREEGIYAWHRKGAQDYRVFWVGGSLEDENDNGEVIE